jgi:hypothetical protein
MKSVKLCQQNLHNITSQCPAGTNNDVTGTDDYVTFIAGKQPVINHVTQRSIMLHALRTENTCLAADRVNRK